MPMPQLPKGFVLETREPVLPKGFVLETKTPELPKGFVPETRRSEPVMELTPTPYSPEEQFGRILGTERGPVKRLPERPFMEEHPTLYGIGKAIETLPQGIQEFGEEVVAGATLGLSRQAEKLGEYLSEKITGRPVPKKEKILPEYMKTVAEMAGAAVPIGAVGKIIAEPLIKLAGKSRYLEPFAKMIGWGVAGTAYETANKMASEGELPSPEEMAKSGGLWAGIEGILGATGWTGRLAIGINNLAKTWGMPRQEVLKVVLAEAKARKMPIARYAYAKAKVQKVLGEKVPKAAEQLVNVVETLNEPFIKRGTYQNLIDQLKDEELTSKVKMFKDYAGKGIEIGKEIKPVSIIKKVEKAPKVREAFEKPGFMRTAEDILALREKPKPGLMPEPITEKPIEIISGLRPRPPMPRKEIMPSFDIIAGQSVPERLTKAIGKPEQIERLKKIGATTEEAQIKEIVNDAVTQKVNTAKALTARGKKEVADKLIAEAQANAQKLKLADGPQTEKAINEALGKAVEPPPVEAKAIPETIVISRRIEQAIGKGASDALSEARKAWEIRKDYTHSGLERLKSDVALGVQNSFALKRWVAEKMAADLIEGRKTLLDKLVKLEPIKEAELNNLGIYPSTITTWGYERGGRNIYHHPRYQPKPTIPETKKVKALKEEGITLGFGPLSELERTYKQVVDRIKARQKIEPFAKPTALPEEKNLSQKFINVLPTLKRLRGEQEAIYTKERGIRFERAQKAGEAAGGGVKGYIEELKKLEGEMPKVIFEKIKDKFTQKDFDNLFRMVDKSPAIGWTQKLSVRNSLMQLFESGKPPIDSVIPLLESVFGKDLSKALIDQKGLWWKLKNAGLEIANLPRSIMASYDLSFGFRQGVFMAPSHRKAFWKSWKEQFREFGSEKAYQAAMETVSKHPDFELASKSGISFTNVGKILIEREERFASSWAEIIPGVRASSRAYTAFANKFRMDIFSSLVKDAEKQGLNPRRNMTLLKEIAGFVNAGTGRGSLGGLEKASLALNAFFFSPRLMASRLKLLNPVYYIRQSPFVRKEALKSLLKFSATATTVLTLAKLGGAEVETDMRSSDWAKIRIGKTRIDILGGFQQYIKSAAQLISGKIVSSTTGKVLTLGEGYKPLTRLDILGRTIEYKEAPIFSFATTLLRGKTPLGEDIEIGKEIGSRFVPMVTQDIYDIVTEQPELLPLVPLGAFGFGLQTYGPERKGIVRTRKERPRIERKTRKRIKR